MGNKNNNKLRKYFTKKRKKRKKNDGMFGSEKRRKINVGDNGQSKPSAESMSTEVRSPINVTPELLELVPVTSDADNKSQSQIVRTEVNSDTQDIQNPAMETVYLKIDDSVEYNTSTVNVRPKHSRKVTNN